MAAFIAGVAAVSYYYFFYAKQKHGLQGAQLMPVKVEVGIVTEHVVHDSFETFGSLNSNQQVQVSPESAGLISAVLYKPGSWVKKGTALIQLDDKTLKSELRSASAQYQLSKAQLSRISTLEKKNMASKQELEQAVADMKEKASLVAVKQNQVNQMLIKAPFSGYLGDKQANLGAYVNVGQPLTELVDNSVLKVRYQVAEKYLSRLKLGQEVLLYTKAYPNQSFKATVDYIAPTVDEQTRSITLEAAFINDNNRLKPGMFVRLKHRFNTQHQVVMVPEESLVNSVAGQFVYIVNDSHVKSQKVIVGRHINNQVEVLKGMSQGQTVVTAGQQKLKDGMAVEFSINNKKENL